MWNRIQVGELMIIHIPKLSLNEYNMKDKSVPEP